MFQYKRQKGMTFLGWLFVLAILGFFVLLFLKITPIYLEYFKIQRAWENFEKNSDGLYNLSARKTYLVLERYLIVEDIDELIKQDDIKIKRLRDAKVYSYDRVNEQEFFKGLYVVGKFHFEFTKERGE